MREIKFRAWAHGSKAMFKPSIEDGWDLLQGSLYPLPNTTLMQYTGLKDKNGTEIYEGDITRRGVIVFERGKFQGYYFDSNGNLNEPWEDDLYLEKNIEVIGNVYENPELLTNN